MRVARSIAELQVSRAELAVGAAPIRVALVPTMGALHRGHTSLIELAREESDVVAVSIFVNPLQFGPNEDYARYPRPLADDLVVCEQLQVDLVFVPPVTELYPPDRSVSISAGPLGEVFEGAIRPGHFDGVLTVVLKLFNLLRPHVAIFGEKDLQQLALIRRMVIDLNLDVEVVGAPIVRESDGLALSSRNRYLSPAERTAALALSAALRAGQREATAETALAAARAVLSATSGLRLDYLALVDPATFTEIRDDHHGPASLIVAARVGSTRMIDNAAVRLHR